MKVKTLQKVSLVFGIILFGGAWILMTNESRLLIISLLGAILFYCAGGLRREIMKDPTLGEREVE